MRPSYEQSVATLKQRVEIVGDPLPSLDRRPRHDDDVLGPSIVRMQVADVSAAGLTLPCLYVGRSELRKVVFAGADLHLSTLNWNDVVECDFSKADFVEADLRACRFRQCTFRGADLSRADLRGSTFDRCLFDGASMRGTRLQRPRRRLGFLRVGASQESLPLSGEQRKLVDWCEDAPEPGGG